MATLKEIIQREVNPFDTVTFTTGNFWTENNQAHIATVQSIHQSAIDQIQNVLAQITRDNFTRSILLTGDSGCGKSYLLKRLKKTLNDRAFFVYIEPCLNNDLIWQHTLRHTVDGLMHIPEGEKESQLLMWLKGLSAYKDKGIKKRILGAKNHFIHELRSIYPTGIYQPRDFFSVLYSLANPDLYFSACDWLRGNSVSEEELKLLEVSSVIDTEDAAKSIIANFGRISADNKPIAICFDQVEAGAKFSDNSVDVSAVVNLNTAFHNNNLKNFLLIISITQNNWQIAKNNVIQADLARINHIIVLKQITVKQVKALWANRLSLIHSQLTYKPDSPIEPLNEQVLIANYRGGKANLRDSLELAGKLYGQIKINNKPVDVDDPELDSEDLSAPFKLLWQNEFERVKNQITRIRQLSSPELVEMLMSAISIFEVEQIKPKLLSGVYAAYSCSYRSKNGLQVGILWDEDPNLVKFSNAMKACRKLLQAYTNISLFLIRSESLGNKRNKGYQIHEQIFNNPSHQHIKASLESIHYLKTYQKLVNDAQSGDLVLNYEPLKLPQLQELVRKTEILEGCNLLQRLEIFESTVTPPPPPPLEPVKEFLLNFVKHHQFLGQQTLIKQVKIQFSDVAESDIEQQIQELVKEKKISLINPQAKPQERLICLIPEAVAGGKK